MKKFFALILICTLCLVLCACGQQAQAPETDGGGLYHAEILSDRDYYYALIFDVREDAGTTYHSTEEQVFASFGLIS